jgi:hypothetical protein
MSPVHPQVCRIVLTGGPCAGKTTVQSVLTDVFTNLGWKVYRVAEVASFLLTGGVDFAILDRKDAQRFQANLLRAMLSVEQTYFDLATVHARLGQNTIIICDRGAMDTSVFVGESEWSQIMSELNVSEMQLRDNRYDCVVHMRTAAIGAESFYTTTGHACRKETISQARVICEKALQAWMGHPYLSIIDNSTDFDEKLQRTVAAVLARCGLRDPALPGTLRCKWKVKVTDDPIPLPVRDFEVEHRMLMASDGHEARLCRRGQDGNFIYTLAVNSIVDGKHVEQRRNLSPREYDAFLLQSDPDCVPIRKLRRCFVWRDRYYHLDYHSDSELILLEAHLPAPSNTQEVDWRETFIPPFVTDAQDVSHDSAYALGNLCRRTNTCRANIHRTNICDQ